MGRLAGRLGRRRKYVRGLLCTDVRWAGEPTHTFRDGGDDHRHGRSSSAAVDPGPAQAGRTGRGADPDRPAPRTDGGAHFDRAVLRVLLAGRRGAGRGRGRAGREPNRTLVRHRHRHRHTHRHRHRDRHTHRHTHRHRHRDRHTHRHRHRDRHTHRHRHRDRHTHRHRHLPRTWTWNWTWNWNWNWA